MMLLGQRVIAIGVAVFLCTGPLIAAESLDANAPHFISSKDLQAHVAKADNGLATFALPMGPGGAGVLARREKTGDAEIHMSLNDEFVVLEGRATVHVGGRIDGNKETAPNEWRGGTITGGQDYEMSPGDVLWIPAGMPHQIRVPAGRAFTYLAFKFERKAAADK